MFRPENPLAPRGPVFDEAWQAQVLAIADTLVQSGQIAATDWADTLGAALAKADAAGLPDTTETYYNAALEALETLVATVGIPAAAQAERKAAWEAAYRRTPHGKPVLLSKG